MRPTKKKRLPTAAPRSRPATRISYTELFLELATVLQAVTRFSGITKSEQLHATPRLGIISNVASQTVAQTFNARPKIKALGLKCTTHDVGGSETVLELNTLLWGKLPAVSKQ